MNHPVIRKEYNYLMNEAKKKYELNYDRAVQDLYDIRDKALEAGSFNAAISAQNSLLKVGGLIVDRKEVMFGKIDQMSREEVEKRLEQLMGSIAAIDPVDLPAPGDPAEMVDEADTLEALEEEDLQTANPQEVEGEVISD
jgi:hypothetical protein